MTRPTMAAVRELAGFKEPVRVATTANIDLASGGLLTIDGVTLVAGERVLVKNQTDATENGIYLASAGEWYRAPDAMSSRNIGKGVLVWVASGSVNEDRVYAFDTLTPDIGTDNIVLVLQDWSGGAAVEIDYATVADVRSAATGDKVFTTDLIEGASALVALVDGTNISFDWDSGLTFTVTLGGNRTLLNPTNGQPGTWRTVVVTQDGVGSKTLAFGDQYRFVDGVDPVLSTDAAAEDVLSILCISATKFFVFVAYGMA